MPSCTRRVERHFFVRNPWGRRHGSMRPLGLLQPVEQQGQAIIERELAPAVEQAVQKQAKKLGWD